MSFILELFTKSDCAPCQVVKETLTTANLPFIVYSLDDPSNLARAKELGIRSVPTIRVLNGVDREMTRFIGNDILNWISAGANCI